MALEMSLLCYPMITNITVNRNLTSVPNIWHNYSECFKELVNSDTFLHDKLKSHWQMISFLTERDLKIFF